MEMVFCNLLFFLFYVLVAVMRIFKEIDLQNPIVKWCCFTFLILQCVCYQFGKLGSENRFSTYHLRNLLLPLDGLYDSESLFAKKFCHVTLSKLGKNVCDPEVLIGFLRCSKVTILILFSKYLFELFST